MEQSPEKLNDQAIVFAQKGEGAKAIKFLTKALILNPKYKTARTNLAAVYNNLGVFKLLNRDIKGADDSFKKAVSVNPGYSMALSNLVDLVMATCSFDEVKRYGKRLDEVTQRELTQGIKAGITPFLDIARHQDPRRNLKVAASWSKSYEVSPNQMFIHALSNKRGKLKIGFVSEGFRDYPTSHNIVGVLKEIDRKKFTVYAYSYGGGDGSIWVKEIQNSVDFFRDISKLDDKGAADVVAGDKIDILIDLKGHTRNARMQIFAFKPAPVIISYLGFVGSTGSSFHDYFIADKVVLPKNETKYFSEKILYLPDTYWPTNNKSKISDIRYKRSDFGLPEDSFIFASFNQGYKIDNAIFDIWTRILKRVPGSVLWLWNQLGPEEENLKRYAESRGLDKRRLIFSTRLSKPEHLKRLTLADIMLDTKTVNGHTTVADSLWVGLPVITIKGKHLASRVAASMLSAAGLPELVTHDLKQYEHLAVSLALNPKKLQAVSQKLQGNKLKYPLFDTKHYTRNFEKVLIKAYKG